MKLGSLTNDMKFKEDKVSINVMMETEISKEIRILFRKGQEMKKHKAGFPITIEIFDGSIDFGVNDEKLNLVKGDIIYLDANVPHDLHAAKESIVRLTLSKMDQVKRVENVIG